MSVAASLTPVEENQAIGRAWTLILDALDTAHDERTLLRRALRHVHALVPYDAATLWRHEAPRLVAVAAQGYREDASPLGRHLYPQEHPIFHDLLTQHDILYVPDTTRDPRFSSHEPHHRRSWLGVPVQTRGQLLGVLVLEARPPRAFSSRHITLAKAFARLLAQSWHHQRTLAQLRAERTQAQELAQRLERLHTVVRDLTSTLDPHRIWHRAVRHLQNALQAQRVTALEARPNGQARVKIELPALETDGDREASVPLSALFAFLEQNRDRLLTVRDPHEETLLASAQAFFAARHRGHTLIVPVADDANLYGVFIVWKAEPFLSEHIELARKLAQQTAASLRTAQEYHTIRATHLEPHVVEERTAALRAEHRRAQLMAHVFAELAGSLDLDQVLNRTLDTLREGLNAVQGVVLHIPPNDPTHIVWLAGRGPRRPALGGQAVELPADDPWLQRVARENKVLLIEPNTPWPPGWAEHFGRYPRGVAAPLLLGTETHGVLLLLSDRDEPWPEADIELVQATAMQMATVIQNANVVHLLHQQIAETTKISRQRQVEASRMRAILEAVADGILVTDPKGQVTLVNPSAERLLGLKAEDLVGQHLERFRGLFGAQGQAWLKQICHWSQHPDAHTPGETATSQIELEDGRVLAIHLAPVFMQHRFLGTVSAIRDITHHIELDRMKSEFVATVSHELRTPLTAIKGYVDLLSRPDVMGDLNPKQTKAIRVIQRHVRRLTNLVDDLLTLSRLESGRMRIEPQEMDLREILREIVDDFRRQIKEKQRDLQLVLDVPPDLPHVYADPQRVRQIVSNLVENACRYTPDGGRVTVRARAVDGFVQFSVQDTGIGIRPENLHQVFERFYRGEHPLVMKTAGTGLGLAIVKQLIEMHGGRIWAESTGVPGEGSTFHGTLPVMSEALRHDHPQTE